MSDDEDESMTDAVEQNSNSQMATGLIELFNTWFTQLEVQQQEIEKKVKKRILLAKSNHAEFIADEIIGLNKHLHTSVDGTIAAFQVVLSVENGKSLKDRESRLNGLTSVHNAYDLSAALKELEPAWDGYRMILSDKGGKYFSEKEAETENFKAKYFERITWAQLWNQVWSKSVGSIYQLPKEVRILQEIQCYLVFKSNPETLGQLAVQSYTRERRLDRHLPTEVEVGTLSNCFLSTNEITTLKEYCSKYINDLVNNPHVGGLYINYRKKLVTINQSIKWSKILHKFKGLHDEQLAIELNTIHDLDKIKVQEKIKEIITATLDKDKKTRSTIKAWNEYMQWFLNRMNGFANADEDLKQKIRDTMKGDRYLHFMELSFQTAFVQRYMNKLHELSKLFSSNIPNDQKVLFKDFNTQVQSEISSVGNRVKAIETSLKNEWPDISSPMFNAVVEHAATSSVHAMYIKIMNMLQLVAAPINVHTEVEKLEKSISELKSELISYDNLEQRKGFIADVRKNSMVAVGNTIEGGFKMFTNAQARAKFGIDGKRMHELEERVTFQLSTLVAKQQTEHEDCLKRSILRGQENLKTVLSPDKFKDMSLLGRQIPWPLMKQLIEILKETFNETKEILENKDVLNVKLGDQTVQRCNSYMSVLKSTLNTVFTDNTKEQMASPYCNFRTILHTIGLAMYTNEQEILVESLTE